MPTPKGKGTKVTPGERRRYDLLRDAGWSPEAAADAVGRSKSWAYLYEQEKRAETLRQDGADYPDPNLSDGVELIVAEQTGDQERAFAVVDVFGAGVVPLLCAVAWWLATERACTLQEELEGLLEGEPMEVELAKAPITPEDILRTIPPSMDRHLSGETPSGRVRWMPPRAEAWMDRLLETYPDLAEIEDEAVEALRSGGRDALREMQRRKWTQLDT